MNILLKKLANYLKNKNFKNEYDMLAKIAAAGEGFEHWFDYKDRVYIPYMLSGEELENKMQEKHSILVDLLKNNFNIDESMISLKDKSMFDPNIGKKISLNGKFFIKFITSFLTSSETFKNISEDSFKSGKLNFINEFKNIVLIQNFPYTFSLLTKRLIKEDKEDITSLTRSLFNDVDDAYIASFDFLNDYSYSTKTKKIIAISKDEDDIRNMSTQRRWKSCTELGKSNYSSAVCESQTGGFIAYLIDEDDLDIINPYSRILVRKFVSDDRLTSVAIAEEEIYGMKDELFQERVNAWIESKQGKINPGNYYRRGGSQSDTFEEEHEVVSKENNDPETEKKHLNFILNLNNLENIINSNQKYYFLTDTLSDFIHSSGYEDKIIVLEYPMLFENKQEANDKIKALKDQSKSDLEYIISLEKQNEVLEDETFEGIIEYSYDQAFSDYRQAVARNQYPEEFDDYLDIDLEEATRIAYDELYYLIGDDEELQEVYDTISEFDDEERKAVNIYENDSLRFNIEEISGREIIENPSKYLEYSTEKAKRFFINQMKSRNTNLPWKKIFKNYKMLLTFRASEEIVKKEPSSNIEKAIEIFKDMGDDFSGNILHFGSSNYFTKVTHNFYFIENMKNFLDMEEVSKTYHKIIIYLNKNFSGPINRTINLIHKAKSEMSSVKDIIFDSEYDFSLTSSSENIKVNRKLHNLYGLVKEIANNINTIKNLHRDDYFNYLNNQNLYLVRFLFELYLKLNQNFKNLKKSIKASYGSSFDDTSLKSILSYIESDLNYGIAGYTILVTNVYTLKKTKVNLYFQKNFKLGISDIKYDYYKISDEGSVEKDYRYIGLAREENMPNIIVDLEAVAENESIIRILSNNFYSKNTTNLEHLLNEFEKILENIEDIFLFQKDIVKKIKMYKKRNMINKFNSDDFQEKINSIISGYYINKNDLLAEDKTNFDFFKIDQILFKINKVQKIISQNYRLVYYKHIPTVKNMIEKSKSL